MSTESTTPELAELAERILEATSARDFDALAAMYAVDVVYDMSPVGMGIHHGRRAMRGFFEDWLSSYEDFDAEFEEIRDLGHGVALVVVLLRGRLPGSRGWVHLSYAAVTTWADGVVEHVTNYADIDQGRAAAERLAEERG